VADNWCEKCARSVVVCEPIVLAKLVSTAYVDHSKVPLSPNAFFECAHEWRLQWRNRWQHLTCTDTFHNKKRGVIQLWLHFLCLPPWKGLRRHMSLSAGRLLLLGELALLSKQLISCFLIKVISLKLPLKIFVKILLKRESFFAIYEKYLTLTPKCYVWLNL